jgi:bifunctional UDP-N-acetylglucosamine pyrophosphorylase/glucosamine-1-phosphate N-acetyltransferase/UDP-N-acetylglucosamine pyrophosphorylase
MRDAVAIVMAAGKGTRMKSELPKVLFPLCGRPMVEYVLDALDEAGIGRVLPVVGYRADLVREKLAGRPNLEFVEQREQLGTGHAVMVCREALAGHTGPVLIVTGDSPMVQSRSLGKLLAEFEARRPACLLGTAHKENPHGLGRIVRDAEGGFLGIVEEKDATPEQRLITEVNMSCYVFGGDDLRFALDRITNENAQHEYYITDCPKILRAAGRPIEALSVLEPRESLSINNLDELALVESIMRGETEMPRN